MVVSLPDQIFPEPLLFTNSNRRWFIRRRPLDFVPVFDILSFGFGYSFGLCHSHAIAVEIQTYH